MLEISRTKSSYDCFNWCNPYSYTFITDDSKIFYTQIGSGDLSFLCEPKDYQDKINIVINKSDNILLYQAFNKLYNNVIYEMSFNEHYFVGPVYERLYDGNKLSFQSDAMADEENMYNGSKERAYNYLNVSKNDDTFELEFINNSGNKKFCIEFNTDRSRYERLVFHFVILIRDLKDVTEPCRQITTDEYLNKKRLIKK